MSSYKNDLIREHVGEVPAGPLTCRSLRLSIDVWKVRSLMNRLTLHISVLLSRSVLESDPEFGFEEAKRQLEGIQVSLHPIVFTQFDVRNDV